MDSSILAAGQLYITETGDEYQVLADANGKLLVEFTSADGETQAEAQIRNLLEDIHSGWVTRSK